MRHGMDAFIVREEVVKETPKVPAAEEALVEMEGLSDAVPSSSEPSKKPTVKTRKVIYPADIHRVLYRPWLYIGTQVGTKLDG